MKYSSGVSSNERFCYHAITLYCQHVVCCGSPCIIHLLDPVVLVLWSHIPLYSRLTLLHLNPFSTFRDTLPHVPLSCFSFTLTLTCTAFQSSLLCSLHHTKIKFKYEVIWMNVSVNLSSCFHVLSLKIFFYLASLMRLN